jgi:tRNA pseudouridine55 synthase
VVEQVRKWAGQRRVGHLGTLDPLATGVLPIALGEATKLSQLLTHGSKAYRGTVRLGIETTTYDREGEVVEEREGPWPDREVIEKALEPFRGEIAQTPPPYSAVKRGGQASYRRARRRGEDVELEPRLVRIDRIELMDYDAPLAVIEVDCSSGTYLRSIAHDLGESLGTLGTLWSLVRTRSGPFMLEDAVPLDDLEKLAPEKLTPMAAATGLPTFAVDGRTSRRVANGVQLGRQELKGAPAQGVFQLVREGRMVALVEAFQGVPELKTLRVFLEGTQ